MSEPFQVHNGATGKTTAIRELTDEQLAFHLKDAQTQLHSARLAFGQAVQNVVTLESVAAILAFEIDRREKSIQLATVSDLSRLRKN